VQLTYIYALRVSDSGWGDGLGAFGRNPWLHGAVLVSLALQVLAVATPVGNRLFSTTPLTGAAWVLAGGLAVAAFLAVVALGMLAGRRGGETADPSDP
jgi:magnesium-transporting ATPase (P-type)